MGYKKNNLKTTSLKRTTRGKRHSSAPPIRQMITSAPEIQVGTDRTKWTNSIKALKPFFIDILADCLEKPFYMESKTVPMVISAFNETTDKEELSYTELKYTGNIQLTWGLIGGIVYEYIFNVDTSKKNADFTPTSDVDLPVCIPDIFYKEDNETMKVDLDKVLDSSFFKDLVDQIIKRFQAMDLSYINSMLDDLPEHEGEEEYFDLGGKIRIISNAGNKLVKTMVTKKIQLFISINGQYDEIVDMMTKFEEDMQSQKEKFTCIVKKGHDGAERKIHYTPLERLLTSEIDALQARYVLGNVKTENHVGRIMYIFKTIVASGNTVHMQSAMMDATVWLSKMSKSLEDFPKPKRFEASPSAYKKLADKVLCTYKGKNMTIKDILSPIAPYAIGRHSPWFRGIFPDFETANALKPALQPSRSKSRMSKRRPFRKIATSI